MTWQSDVRKKFKELKEHSNDRCSTEIDGFSVTTFPNVFSPAVFYESRWFGREMSKIVEGGDFLEIGTGTGIVAMYVAKKGLAVTLVDINSRAIENALFNFRDNKLPEPKAYVGSVYEPLATNARYDYIFWNHPFNKGEQQETDVFLKSVFDYGYEHIEQYIAEAGRHLKKQGRLFLGTSSIADLEEIEKLAHKYQYKLFLHSKIDRLSEVEDVKTDFRVYEFQR